MKIIIEDKPQDEEDVIIVRCNTLDDSLLRLLQSIKSKTYKIAGIKDGKTTMIDPKDIYYFESVDNKVFLYQAKDVYEVKLKLYEIEQKYAEMNFFRASKSVIINPNKIKTIEPVLGSRLEIVLLNQERIIISRQYVGELKRLLGL